jgi:hypothetical protein
VNRFLAFIVSTALLYAATVELTFVSNFVLTGVTAFFPSIVRPTIEVANYHFSIAFALVQALCGLLAGFIAPAFDRTRWSASAWTISLFAIVMGLLPPWPASMVNVLRLGAPCGVGIALGTLLSMLKREYAGSQTWDHLLPRNVGRRAVALTVFWCLIWAGWYANSRFAEDMTKRVAPAVEAQVGAGYEKYLSTTMAQLDESARDAVAIGVAGAVMGVLALGVIFTVRRTERAAPAVP